LGDVFATIDIDPFKSGDELQSNILALAGDAAPIDQNIMDMDIKRSGMNEMDKNLSMSTMRKEEPCEDTKSEKYCQKYIKYCDSEKFKPYCKKTCGLCQDKCQDTLDNLHCLSECPKPVSGSEPSRYYYILGRCYYFEATPMHFNESMENCKTRFGSPGGRLFEPRNSVVNDKIANKAKSTDFGQRDGLWIGIRTDPEFSFIQRHFFYLSGGPFTSLSYGNWYPGEPNNNGGEENCVDMYVPRDGKWNDYRCDHTLPSICEMGHEVIW